jgi:hypothetical protein
MNWLYLSMLPYERESTRRGRKRKYPPDEFEEGVEKSWSREDVALRVHGKFEHPNVALA